MKISPLNQAPNSPAKREAHIFRVAFKEPPLANNPCREFNFHSLAAIYELFTPEQVGCKVTRLWNIGVAEDNPYIGRLCTITCEPIYRKRQKRL